MRTLILACLLSVPLFAQIGPPSGGNSSGGGCTTTGSAIQKASAGCTTAAVVGDFPSVTVLAADNSGSTTTYTAPGVPVPTTYANVAMFILIPQTNGAGGAMTLNVASLGPVALKDKDCSTNLGSTSLVAGQVYLFPYNGTVACLGATTSSGTVGGTVTPTWTSGGTTTCAFASAALCKPTAANTGNTTLANTGMVSGATYSYIITNDPATTRTVTYPGNMATGPAMPAQLSVQMYFSCTYDGTNVNCGPATLLNGTAGIIGPFPEATAPSTTLVPAGEVAIYGDSTSHVPCGIENGSSTAACMVKTGADVGTNGQVTNLSHVSNASLPHTGIAATAVTPGAYTAANITVAADGSITAAANGASSVSCPSQLAWQPFQGYGQPTTTGVFVNGGVSNYATLQSINVITPICSSQITFQVAVVSGTCGGTCGFLVDIATVPTTGGGTFGPVCVGTVATSGGAQNINALGALVIPWASGSDVSGGVCTLPAGLYSIRMTSDSTALKFTYFTNGGTSGNFVVAQKYPWSFSASATTISTGTGGSLAFNVGVTGTNVNTGAGTQVSPIQIGLEY